MKIYAALDEDAQQGWVWLQDTKLKPRGVVKITNPSTGKSIHCEALQIDKNFLERYNKKPRVPIKAPASALVMGAWYRANLGGLVPQTDVPLKITSCWSWLAQFKACTDHPQVVVRLAAWLGALGLLLGIIGLLIGIASL